MTAGPCAAFLFLLNNNVSLEGTSLILMSLKVRPVFVQVFLPFLIKSGGLTVSVGDVPLVHFRSETCGETYCPCEVTRCLRAEEIHPIKFRPVFLKCVSGCLERRSWLLKTMKRKIPHCRRKCENLCLMKKTFIDVIRFMVHKQLDDTSGGRCLKLVLFTF